MTNEGSVFFHDGVCCSVRYQWEWATGVCFKTPSVNAPSMTDLLHCSAPLPMPAKKAAAKKPQASKPKAVKKAKKAPKKAKKPKAKKASKAKKGGKKA